MSVLIKGIEMPDNCSECKFLCNECFEIWCCVTDREDVFLDDRPDWCPLAALPEKHGRLFDETEVKRCLQELPDTEDKWNAIALLEWAIEKRWCIDCDWFLRDPTPEERKSVDDYIQSISENTGVTWDILTAEEIKCCGNCVWFDGEDIYGWGFCDEKEAQMHCESRCVKWKGRGAEGEG